MKNLSKQELELVIERAFAAAQTAAQNWLDEHGDRDACGFAWAVVKPANSRLARLLKEKYGGTTAAFEPGLMVWNPSRLGTQSITALEVGAREFASVLHRATGANVFSYSRLD